MFVLVAFLANVSALPAPTPFPQPVAFPQPAPFAQPVASPFSKPEKLKEGVSKNDADLQDGEEEKDLKGSESAYYGGYYGAYPGAYLGYPSYFYSSVYRASPYYPYSYYW